jgi:hypothetical protein
MDQLVKLIVEMLNNSCGSLSPELDELEKYNGGYQQYVIETHCVQFTINAKRNKAYSDEDPRGWDIRDWSMQPC